MAIEVGPSGKLSKEQRMVLIASDKPEDQKYYYDMMMKDARDAVDESYPAPSHRRVGFRAPRRKSR